MAERAAICRRMVDWCVQRADELGDELSWQMGRPVRRRPASSSAASRSARCTCRSIRRRRSQDISVRRKAGFRRFIRREPLGVVLVVAPWNYP